jgi:arsenite-transporting ATPase
MSGQHEESNRMWTDGLTTKYLFFTGKGGVGKTSLSCAAALKLAKEGLRVLIVSTDPASNLDEVLGFALSTAPRPSPDVSGLFAANLDPDAAAAAYRERAVAPFRGILPESALRSIEEQFSGACTTEIAAFDEFTQLLAGEDVAGKFDHIVFDTAPTGHTLRLLSLPAAWTGFIDTNTSGVSCLGPLSALKKQEDLYRASVATLKDAALTTLVLVARADEASLKEAGRAGQELAELGIENQRLLINGVFRASSDKDGVANALERRCCRALQSMPPILQTLPSEQIPLLPGNVIGLAGIEALLTSGRPALNCAEPILVEPTDTLDQLVARISADGHGVVMAMGKGGVGKTSLAARIACDLARRGHDVLLTTTDPAAHVLESVRDIPPGLEIACIDPQVVVEEHRAEVLGDRGMELDADALAVLEEDLRSPCTEEIAVFRAFAEAVGQGTDRFVVLDTAPTGHTILLLDAAQAYHREVLRTQTSVSESVMQLLPRLRDPAFTKVILVTLPEPTPVHEAAQLQQDLRRAGITPFAWVVNQSLSASGTQDPILLAKAAQESQSIAEVFALTPRFSVLPWRETGLMQ